MDLMNIIAIKPTPHTTAISTTLMIARNQAIPLWLDGEDFVDICNKTFGSMCSIFSSL
jgi:hypothetical protein